MPPEEIHRVKKILKTYHCYNVCQNPDCFQDGVAAGVVAPFISIPHFAITSVQDTGDLRSPTSPAVC